MYLRDKTTKTYRCADITNMCDTACTTCDKSGLQATPPVLTGICTKCMVGYYVSNLGKCNSCPALCYNCTDITGSCNSCASIKYTLYNDVS